MNLSHSFRKGNLSASKLATAVREIYQFSQGKVHMFCEGNAEFSPTFDLSSYFYGFGQRTSESAYELVLDFFGLNKSDVFKVRLIDGNWCSFLNSQSPSFVVILTTSTIHQIKYLFGKY